jgi:hypothetical protein
VVGSNVKMEQGEVPQMRLARTNDLKPSSYQISNMLHDQQLYRWAGRPTPYIKYSKPLDNSTLYRDNHFTLVNTLELIQLIEELYSLEVFFIADEEFQEAEITPRLCKHLSSGLEAIGCSVTGVKYEPMARWPPERRFVQS